MIKTFYRNLGFSLVELLITVAVIGILGAIAVPSYTRYKVEARRSEATQFLPAVYSTQLEYFAEMGAYTVIVEEDIDPSNLDQVLWAMVTRARLDRQIHIIPDCHTNNVNTAIPPEEKMAGEAQKPITAARVVVDACRDYSWKEDWYPIARLSPELRGNLLKKWKSTIDKFL